MLVHTSNVGDNTTMRIADVINQNGLTINGEHQNINAKDATTIMKTKARRLHKAHNSCPVCGAFNDAHDCESIVAARDFEIRAEKLITKALVKKLPGKNPHPIGSGFFRFTMLRAEALLKRYPTLSEEELIFLTLKELDDMRPASNFTQLLEGSPVNNRGFSSHKVV